MPLARGAVEWSERALETGSDAQNWITAMTDKTPTGTKKPDHAYAARRPKTPAFARYEGTSAWRKDRRKVRAYAMFKAVEKAGHAGKGTAQA